MVMTMLAAAAINKGPLDLVITNGTAFTLLRLREDELLMYEDLPAQQVGVSMLFAAARLCRFSISWSMPTDTGSGVLPCLLLSPIQ